MQEILTRLERIETALATLIDQRTIKDFYSTDEVAALLRVSTKTIRRAVSAKQLRSERVGTVGPKRKGKILIPRSGIDQYRASRATGPDLKPPPPRLKELRQKAVINEEKLRVSLFDQSVVKRYEPKPK